MIREFLFQEKVEQNYVRPLDCSTAIIQVIFYPWGSGLERKLKTSWEKEKKQTLKWKMRAFYRLVLKLCRKYLFNTTRKQAKKDTNLS